jgi:hypothetical protein
MTTGQDDAPFDSESIAEQREQLALVRECEEELSALRARSAGLEVDLLAAKVALKSGTGERLSTVTPAHAAELLTLLGDGGVRGTAPAFGRDSSVPDAPVPIPPTEERSRYETAAGSLRDWLAAAEQRDQPATRAAIVIRFVLLALVLSIIWAAIEVHIALLILLLPISVPYSMLKGAGDDVRWKRMGAKRHFERTCLAAPGVWDAETVRRRLQELEQVLARMREAAGAVGRPRPLAGAAASASENSATGSVGMDTYSGRTDRSGNGLESSGGDILDARLEQDISVIESMLSEDASEQRLRALMIEHQLEMPRGEVGFTPDTQARLMKLASVHHATQAVAELEQARRAADATASDAREAVFRYLARRSVAPTGGAAHVDALGVGLDKLAARL